MLTTAVAAEALPRVPFDSGAAAVARRAAILDYAIVLVAFARRQGVSPRELAGWMHRQYVEHGWYDQFEFLTAEQGAFAAFVEEFAHGRQLLHDDVRLAREADVATVWSEPLDERADLAACYFFDLDPDDLTEFFAAVVERHTRRLGITTHLESGRDGETLEARDVAPPDDTVTVRTANADDRGWIGAQLARRWGGSTMISRGRAHDAAAADAFVAVQFDRPVGLLTWVELDGEVEILTLDAFEPGQGIGTALLDAVAGLGRPLTVITGNDNVSALRFYQRRGFRLIEVRVGAIDDARAMKPSIPVQADDGVPIRDELVLVRS